ncbi:zinc finger C3H1 domain-containing protein isoform 2-T2 [Pholidichthys leucotaenia]
MDLNTTVTTTNPSPADDGELEDGEICDDEIVVSVPSRRRDCRRPRGGGPPRPRRPHQHPHSLPPPLMHPPPGFHHMMPYNLGPQIHGPFPPGHRQQCGPSGPDRPPPPSPAPPPPLLGPLCESNPRSNFWERSHGALGRFRHRGMPNGGPGAWNRGGRGGNNRAPPGRYQPSESRSSPGRKPKTIVRIKKVVPRPETPDESFEDLLSKYKQIQLELECIRKEETMALEPNGDNTSENAATVATTTAAAALPEVRAEPEPAQSLAPADEASDLDKAEKKAFQSFNIKPLRQKLPTPADLDEMQKKWAEAGAEGEGAREPQTTTAADGSETGGGPEGVSGEQRPCELGEEPEGGPAKAADGGICVCGTEAVTGKHKTTEEKSEEKVSRKEDDILCVCCSSRKTDSDQTAEPHKARSVHSESSASSEDSIVFVDKPKEKVEEEELSELQLRLLALQSASKKWQQKEQQVMKRSKDRITKATQEKNSSSSSTTTTTTIASSVSVVHAKPPTPSRQRVTRSASAAAAAAATTTSDRSRTRSKPEDRDRDRTKTGARDRDRLPDRGRPKQSPKPGPRSLQDQSRTPVKPHMTKKISPGSAAKQAFRKQQLRTWKLHQQREQEEKRRQEEEEERRKREEEIRRIRDLSNQDEQYNRFMKLVGGKKRTRSDSRERDHRRSSGKASLDGSGNLYQYDNYDEVAMDTDISSPTHNLLMVDEPACFPQMSLYTADAGAFGMNFSRPFLSPILPGVPPPPPPLPPPDESEPPPKPPFADEEEEEEMLLRETCLMSMANKRVALSEKASSAPSSPSSHHRTDVQPIRGNLSTVSLNMVSQPRSNKFARAHHAARTPLVLPRHKSVVVSLNDSDDSDSDMDACSSAQSVFGGLEFMIKEARRTVEAAKPKAASASEKENNPVRTLEVLPESKKAEYRQLIEEIGSREKQKMLKDQSLSQGAGSPSAPDSVLDLSPNPAAEAKLTEAEQRLCKHRELLQRDEAVLRHLLQQEVKKRESLRVAEAKVAKLKEQLQASEKIVHANRTLLKKLQEQVQRVEQRVSMKKTASVHLEQELVQAQWTAGRAPKRKQEASQNQLGKRRRPNSQRHFSELIAQKQRLQQLESEYALKIQKLKEAQALRNKGIAMETLPLPPSAASSPPRIPLPQPSLHDLSQDKLTLDSEDVAEADEPEPTAPAATIKGGRRPSLRQSSFTKPHLDTVTSTPAKDSGAKPAKTSPRTSEDSDLSVETFAGLDVDALKRRYRQQQTPLCELLLRELVQLGQEVDSGGAGEPTRQVFPLEVEMSMSQSGSLDLKPVPYELYHSPLLVFKSYRFSPYYRTKEKLSLSSVTYSNAIDPKTCFCRFDLTGTCNDDGCRWQHMRNCTLTPNQLFQDILSYNMTLIGCSEKSSDHDVAAATEKYMKKLFGTNKDRMGVDQKAVLLVSKVNESKRHVPPYTTCKDMRRWRPKPSIKTSLVSEDDSGEETELGAGDLTTKRDEVSKSSVSALDVCVTSEDRRYFTSETDDISNLEASVLESPDDTQLWIKLAFKYLNQPDTSAAECLEAALNTLSRALETNCDDPEVWSHYLSLFSRRGSREEVQEMCEMAVEHAPDYRVWWNYLNLEISFEGKDYVCERLLQFLLSEAAAAASSEVTDKLSFQLMEALLYRVQLSLFTGRLESALAILQNALKSTQERSVADHLTPSDRALLWLSYIHLTEFDRLPVALYDPARSGPSGLVSRGAFLLPWRRPEDVSTPPDILIALFQDGIGQCGDDESLCDGERTAACLPLTTNLLLLHRLLHRYQEGVSLCESLLESSPDSCVLRDALADFHLRRGDGEAAVAVWLNALVECPHNAEVFYRSCSFLMDQEKSSAVVPLFRGFILSLCEDERSQKMPVDVLRHVLGFPTEEVLAGPVIKKELQDQLSQQTSFLHLIHCRWQWLHGSVDDTAEAFERALGSANRLEELHALWMDYLRFSCSPQARGPAHTQSRRFSDLVQRCLSTVPTRLEVPFNPARFWTCYRFHNKVVSLYLSCLPQSQHALVLERLRYAMPNNTELGLRLLHQEWQDGHMEHLKFQARMLSSGAPECLAAWKIAIAVEEELKEKSEVRLLFQQALQNLPLCAALWKHRLLFEAAEFGPSERLRCLSDCCQQAGVSVSLSEDL